MTGELLIALAMAPLFANDAPLEKRLQVLTPLFDPPLGEMARFHPNHLNKIHLMKEPFAAKGFIKVLPPPHRCLYITRPGFQKEDRVCEPKTLFFDGFQIDQRGEIEWQVITGKGDMGTPIRWPTPYRTGRFIPKGKLGEIPSQPVLIIDCQLEAEKKKITLKIASGETWYIQFPKKDVLMPQPEDRPNLYFATGKKKSPPLAEKDKKENEKAKKKGKEPPPKTGSAPQTEGNQKKKSALERKLANEEEKEEVTYFWSTLPRNTFIMDSHHFYTRSQPAGGEGKCRYKYQGVPHEPAIGVIECTDTDQYDAIIAPLTCSKAMSPSPVKSP